MTSRYILVQKLLLLVIIVLTVAIAAMCWGAFLTDEWITAWGLSARSIPYPDAAASAFNVSSSTPLSLTIGTRRYCVQRHCTTKGPAGFESESTCGRSAANIDSRYTTAYVFTFFSALIACVEMIVLIGRLTALDPASFAYTSPARAGGGGGGGAGAAATTSTNPMKVPTPVTGNSPDDETAMMSSAEVHPVRHAVVATTTPSPRAGLEPVTIEPLTVTRERRAATVGTTKQAALVGAVLRVSPVGVVNFFLLLISVAIIADLENSYLNCGNSTTCNRLIVTSTVLGLPGANCGWGSSFGLIIAATVLSLAVLALGFAWGVAAQRSVEHELSEGYEEDDEAAPPRASFEPAAESKEGISADVGSAMFSSSAIRHPEHSGSLAASPSEQYANDRPNRPPEANM